MIHKFAEVKTSKIGEQTDIWQFSVVLEEAVIGKHCNINCHVFIENDVRIGDYVTIKPGVYLWDGIRIEDHVFIGPNVTFTNDKTPRSKKYPVEFQKTFIRRHASLGAGSIILGGIEVGEFAMTGAGSVVTKDVPERALVAGNPAKITGWLNDDGSKMIEQDGFFIDHLGQKWQIYQGKLLKL
jgi:UDP-2-acetamido-3-amino-2,3-dideoxy-glucuronate N-acetyltransferase